MVYDASRSMSRCFFLIGNLDGSNNFHAFLIANDKAEVFTFDFLRAGRTFIRREDIVKWGSTRKGFHLIAIRVDKAFTKRCKAPLDRNMIGICTMITNQNSNVELNILITDSLMHIGWNTKRSKQDIFYAGLLPQGLNRLGLFVQVSISKAIETQNQCLELVSLFLLVKA